MKKKSILAMTLVAALGVVALAGCGGAKDSGSQVDASSAAPAGNAEVLVVGFDQSFPPMGFKDKEKGFTGFDIELAQMVGEKTGMEIKLQPIDWDSKDAELDSGNINCIWNGFTMTGREGKYEFSKPYMKNRQVIVVKKDADVKNLQDLKGKRLELQQGSTAENALNEHKEFKDSLGEVTMVPENLTALSDLEQGSCDGVLMDEVVARYNIEQGRALKVLDDSLSEEQYAVGLKLGNTELRDKIDEALEALAKEGKLAELSKKYFGEDITLLGK